MDKTTQKICKQYQKKLRNEFPLMRKPERQYLKKLESNISDFYEEKTLSSIEEIYQDFGLPSDVVHTYYSMVDNVSFFSNIHIGKIIRKSIFILCGLLTISAILVGTMLFRKEKSISEKQVYFTIMKAEKYHADILMYYDNDSHTFHNEITLRDSE